jgi:hypothetical protein
MPPLRKKPDGWIVHASTADAARRVARRQAIGMCPEAAILQSLPQDVRRALDTIKPERSRYRSSRLNRRSRHLRRPVLVTAEEPLFIWGFTQVMATIAARAGVSVQTLYRWEQDYRALLHKPRRMRLRPKGQRARRLSGDVYEHTEIPLTQRQRQLRQLADTTLRRNVEIPGYIPLLRIPEAERTDAIKIEIAEHLENELAGRGMRRLRFRADQQDHIGSLNAHDRKLLKYRWFMENWDAVWQRFPPAPEL